jgi:hypothetical protein
MGMVAGVKTGRYRARENVGAPTFKVTLEAYSVWLTEYRPGDASWEKKSG